MKLRQLKRRAVNNAKHRSWMRFWLQTKKGWIEHNMLKGIDGTWRSFKRIKSKRK